MDGELGERGNKIKKKSNVDLWLDLAACGKLDLGLYVMILCGLVVKTPTSICWRLLSVLAFGLTIVGLAWNEWVRLNVNGIRVKI